MSPLTTAQHRFAKRVAGAHIVAPIQPIGERRLAPGMHHEPRSDSWRLLFVAKGTIDANGRPAPAHASVLVPPRAVCQLACRHSAHLYCARFTARLAGGVDALAPLCAAAVVVHQRGAAAPVAWADLLAAAAEVRAGNPWARPRARGLFAQVLALTLEEGFAGGGLTLFSETGPDWLPMVLAAINTRLGDPRLDVAALAYVRALARAYLYIEAGSAFFAGTIDENEAVRRIDIGKPEVTPETVAAFRR